MSVIRGIHSLIKVNLKNRAIHSIYHPSLQDGLSSYAFKYT